MTERSEALGRLQRELSRLEGAQRSVTNLVILACSFGMLFLMVYFYEKGMAGYDGVLTCTVAMMGAFGSVVALSSPSNNLNQTLSSGERVLSILEKEPLVEKIVDDGSGHWDGAKDFKGAEAEHVTFAYGEEKILKDYSFRVNPGRIIGIHGASGSGKSTLLKLLMRF